MRRDIPAQRNQAAACECIGYVRSEFIGDEVSSVYASRRLQSTIMFKKIYDYDCQLRVKHRNLLRVAMIQFRTHVGFVRFLHLGCPPLEALMRFRRGPISRGCATQLRHEPQAEAQNLRRSDKATPVSEAEVSARGVGRSFPDVRAWR